MAFTSIVLLATSELLSAHYGQTAILIDKERLRIAALAVSVASILTIVMVVIRIIATT